MSNVARPKQKQQYKDIQERIIFILLNPENKEFFIGYTLPQRIRKTYCLHYIGNIYKTKNTIERLKTKGLKPCCFQLETVNCSAVQAYRHIIVWTKIFMEQGYINLDTGTVVDYASELLPENIPLYEERKNINLEEMTSCKNCLFPDYGRTICPIKKE